ncbi:MAG: hypothetical protein V4726_18195, partial [Verrucomicrobiota bacterium]
MALVGGFEVEGIVSAEPLTLCKQWQAHSGVEVETFLRYFQCSTQPKFSNEREAASAGQRVG